MAFIVKAIGMFAIITERFGRFVEAFLSAAEHEDEVFQRVDRSEITKQMNVADVERINFFYQIREMLRAMLRSMTPEAVLAAEKLLKVTDIYGGQKLRSQSTKDRSGNLTNMIEDFEKKFSAEVELTGISTALASLVESNARYLELRDSRIMSDSEFGQEAMAKARSASDHTMRVLFQEVSNAAEYGEWEELKDFINYVNSGINEFNWGTGTGSDSEIEEGEEGVIFKNANFVYANGVEVKLKVEVGTPLIAPDNTEGYYWPDLPEFMPKRSFTVREVPIEEAMATAIFHFFDHREEELRQLVGSILTAPENTAGYYWDPTVPETMPAEDTNYYELPIRVEIDPSEGVKVRFMGPDNREMYSVVLPVDGLLSEADYPEPPEGYHWNYTLDYINMCLPSKNAGDVFTVRVQANE